MNDNLFKDSKRLKTKQAYNAIADIYNDDFGQDREFFKLFIDPAINELAKNNLSGKIIDLGSGPGNVVDYLLEKGVTNHIVAVDFAEEFCRLLQSKYLDVTQVQIENDDMVRYMARLPDQSTPLIVANYSFIHVPDNEFDSLLKDIYRSLVPGGYLAFAVWGGQHKGMEPEPYQIQQDRRLLVHDKLESYMNNFTEDEIKKRMKIAGFIDPRIKSFKTTPLPGEFNQPKIVVYAKKEEL